MTKVFFTYVWGPPGNPAWPLTFASIAARSHARAVLTEGDLVFTVGTKSAPTPPEDQGRALGVFRVSNLEVNTQDYGLPRRFANPEFDSVIRFPFALHPVAVWEITSPDNIFAKLVGPLTPNHHLQAQSKVVELEDIVAEPLLELERREVPPAMPITEFGKGHVAQKNSKLAPKHKGSFTGSFNDHDIWYVYMMVLKDKRKKVLAVKVGYSNEPETRVAAHNGPLAPEITGLRWHLYATQPTETEDKARDVEQPVLSRYARNKLASNGELLSAVDPLLVAGEIAMQMRSKSTV